MGTRSEPRPTPASNAPAAPTFGLPRQWPAAEAAPWQHAARLLAGINPWLQGTLVATLILALHEPLAHISRYFWYLPAGARFAALLLLPKRLWAWVILGEWGARWLIEIHYATPLIDRMYSVFPQPLGSVIAVALLRWHDRLPNLDRPAGMLRLLGAIALSAVIEAAINVVYMVKAASLVQAVPPLSTFIPSITLGDFMGVLVVVPAALALVMRRAQRQRVATMLVDGGLGLLLPMLVYHWVHGLSVIALVHDYMRVLITAPTVYFAFRHGWRGAALALTVLSGSVAMYHSQSVAAVPGDTAATQMLLAVVGAAALLFGAAIDTLQNHRRQLALQNTQLLTANTRLESLARELREAARRNLDAEERQRRRIAAELHDELGQNLTALQTRAKLAAGNLPGANAALLEEAIDPILRRMRQSLRSLMDTLRPAVLDEFGLLRALREGPISELLQRAGVVYRFKLKGEPALLDALDDDTRIAAWRMVQEAATNAVKHARASHFNVRLRVALRDDSVWLLLDIRDDGVGLDATRTTRRGHGLQGMRDRMLALDGVFRVDAAQPGTRLRVLLRQAL